MITGDIRSPTYLTQVLYSDPSSNIPVDIIISGIGCYPELKGFKLLNTDPDLCNEGISAILSVLSSRQGSKKPLLVTLGTTGISKLGRDTPHLMVPLYKGLLHSAHRDKEIMERVVEEAYAKQDSPISGYTIVHASLLTYGKVLGKDKVQSEVEGQEWSNKGIGYTISRQDVGNWVFEDSVKGFESVRSEARVVRITY
jgi:hypothetical protein